MPRALCATCRLKIRSSGSFSPIFRFSTFITLGKISRLVSYGQFQSASPLSLALPRASIKFANPMRNATPRWYIFTWIFLDCYEKETRLLFNFQLFRSYRFKRRLSNAHLPQRALYDSSLCKEEFSCIVPFQVLFLPANFRKESGS